MLKGIKQKTIAFLRWSEQYTKADMVYVAQGNFWLMTGRVIAVGGGIALTVALANLFTPEQFGAYKYVLAIAGFVGAFSLGGLGGAVTRAVAQGDRSVVYGVWRAAFLWSVPASVCALVGSAYYYYMGNVQLGTGLLFIALTNAPLNSFTLAKSIMLGEKDFRGLTIYGIPRTLIPIIGIIATLYFTESVLWVLTAYFVSNLIVSWEFYRFVLRKHRIPRIAGPNTQETITYGKHLSVMGVVSQMVGNLDQLLLWHFAGPVQLAIYAFALAPIREIRNFSENIHPLILPKYAVKTVEEMKRTAPLRVAQLLVVSVIIAGLYIIFAPFLYQYIFPQYVSAIFASQLLAASLILQPRNIVETMLYAEGNTRIRYVTIFVTQGAKALLLVLLIPPFGLMGAVAATVATDVVSTLSLWWAYKKLR